jgi:hypothetical protein
MSDDLKVPAAHARGSLEAAHTVFRKIGYGAQIRHPA